MNSGTHGVCEGCQETHVLTDDGLCSFCTKPDPHVEEAIRERLDDLVEQHNLPTVFWSMDNVYDEFDQQMQERDRA